MAILFHLPFLKAYKRTFPFLALLPTVALLLLQSACVQPQTHPPVLSLDPLTPQEQQLAERLASADARVKDLLGRGRQRLIHSEFLALKPEDEARTREDWRQPIQIGRHAEVIFYRYDGNLGVRAVVDLEQRVVKEVTRLDGDEVSLSSGEVIEAGDLALQNEEVRRKLGPTPQEFKVEGMRILATDEREPCYKHRCMELLFRRGAFYLAEFPVTVDLTTQTVRVGRRVQ